MGLDAVVSYSLNPEPEAAEDQDERDSWDKAMNELNRVLRAARLPAYEPPASPEPLPQYGYRVGHYSDLHLLRRYAVYVERGRVPPDEKIDHREDRLLKRAYAACREVTVSRGVIQVRPRRFRREHFAHLIHHSDCEDLYVPFEFPYPLWAQVPDRNSFMSIGSSVRLKRELDVLARKLQLPEDIDPDGPEMDVVNPEGPPWQVYPIAGRVCAVLRELATISVRNHALLLYC